MHDFFQHGFRLTDDDRFKTFRMDFSPWIRSLCEWFDDPEVDWIWLIQGSQTAKTSFLMGAFLYISQFVSGAVPCYWCMSTEGETKIFISDRLKPFLDEAGRDKANSGKWKQSSFRVFNSSLKVGYATTMNTMRSKPARFLFGDECGIWSVPVSYYKKRSRTFAGRRKGFFATVPPLHHSHHSHKEATAGNFYQFFVPCPDCGEWQALRFSCLKWGGKEGDNWNFETVKKTCRYICRVCKSEWQESQKLTIIGQGQPRCVDPHTFEPVKEKKSDTKTLHIPALYSVFTSWGQLACDFLTAKHSGIEALKIFFTDELAEVPKEHGESVKVSEISKFTTARKRGDMGEFPLYTAGCDVQGTGTIYYVICGWQPGPVPSAHIIDYGKEYWKTADGKPEWTRFLGAISKYTGIYRACIDATDGVERSEIVSFALWAGPPYVALTDKGAVQMAKTQWKTVDYQTTRGKSGSGHTISINSSYFKDEIVAALRRDPVESGAWTFPCDTEPEFFEHLGNEHRTTRKRGGAVVAAWEPVFAGAPQHYFSALVYACAAMEEKRLALQTTKAGETRGISPRRVRSKGISIWQ